jgi:hypothetical protein
MAYKAMGPIKAKERRSKNSALDLLILSRQLRQVGCCNRAGQFPHGLVDLYVAREGCRSQRRAHPAPSRTHGAAAALEGSGSARRVDGAGTGR